MKMADINYQDFDTPYFVLDVDELKRSITGFSDALKSNFKKSVVGYSVKTNSTPFCLQKANEFGAYAEVVSHDEYELALLCGFSKDRIIYNGPMKSKETFVDAVSHGAIVNIETKRELQWLESLDAGKVYNVGIRLNINISQVSPDDADGDNDDSRFGFSETSGELAEAIERIDRLPNVKLAGLHIHRTAHSRSIRFYENSVRYACEVISRHNLNLDYLDIGGGYFGIFPNVPTYRQYSDAFSDVLKQFGLENLCVIVEPGNALVASCFTFVTGVIDVKRVGDERWFITTDGSRNDIDPFFRKSGYLDEEIYMHDSPSVGQQIVSGCTCLEHDRLFSLANKPLLGVGDRIVYHNVGAYTMCLSPLFIRYFPKIYAIEGGRCRLIREKWTAKEFVQKSKI